MDAAPSLPLLVVAGETSGDQRAARLLEILRRQKPEVSAFGLGGEQLVVAGLDRLHDSQEIAVVGLFEALRILPRARRIFHDLLDAVVARGCRHALLVDAPDFNLRLARALHRRGVRVLYYVSPQVWAWRRRRVAWIRRFVDRMLVLFPFEVDFYRRAGVEALHVGHPLVDEISPVPVPARASPGERRRIAVLPGSRRSEVDTLLPILLEAAARLGQRMPVDIRLIAAPALDPAPLAAAAAAAAVPVTLVREDRHDAIAGCELAICASGTATLEVGLLGTPMIVVYRLRSWTYWLARRLVRLPHVAMVNLVLDERVAPELLQEDCEPGRIAAEAGSLLESPDALARQRAQLAGLRGRLGAAGASERAAQAVGEWLEATR